MEADYRLVLDGEAAGVIEAKEPETTLLGVKEQSSCYQVGLPEGARQIRFLSSLLLFSYETTDEEQPLPAQRDGAFRKFTYDELTRRDKTNLDIF